MSIDSDLDKELEFLKTNKAEEHSKLNSSSLKSSNNKKESEEIKSDAKKERKKKAKVNPSVREIESDENNETIENNINEEGTDKESPSKKSDSKKIDKEEKTKINTDSDSKIVNDFLKLIDNVVKILSTIIPSVYITINDLVDDMINDVGRKRSTELPIVICIIVIIGIIAYEISSKKYYIVSVIPTVCCLIYIIIDRQNKE